jgi:hypothetical protein
LIIKIEIGEKSRVVSKSLKWKAIVSFLMKSPPRWHVAVRRVLFLEGLKPAQAVQRAGAGFFKERR